MAKTLCIFSKPTLPCSSTNRRACVLASMKAGQMSMPKAEVASTTSAATVSAAAAIVRHAPTQSSAIGSETQELPVSRLPAKCQSPQTLRV